MAMNSVLMAQWREIRQLTYDYLDNLQADQLGLKMPFSESQPIGYQFWCMVGAHESYLRNLEAGSWQGFASSLDGFDKVTPQIIKEQMQAADASMAKLLNMIDLDESLENGQKGYEIVFQMIKHEMHHHGQLINLLYCHHLPIPKSWADEWALAYE